MTDVLVRWRAASLAALGKVEGLVGVLMKRPNGLPWTEEDRAFLRAALATATRWTPAFVLFLLPGGFILLAAYVSFLDRRRRRRGNVSIGP